MKLLITGVNGFVAQHFLTHLNTLNTSISVLGIGRSAECSISERFTNLDFRYQSIDLLNKKEVATAISSFRPNFLLHLASISSVGHSWHHPQESFVNNTNIFLNIIDQIRLEKIPCRILSVGSSEEYGLVSQENIPIKESCPLHPLSPYAVARVSQEMISRIYADGFGMDIVMTRSFNHFGPGQKDIFIIPSFAKQLIAIARSKEKTGRVIVGNINIVRDFVDVRDVAKAYLMLLLHGKKGEVYNVCSGTGVTPLDILKTMENKLQIKVSTEVNAALIRPNDNPIIIGNPQKIKSEIGWETSISLEQSIADTLKYWDNKSNQFN